MKRLGIVAVIALGLYALLSQFVARARVVTFKVGTVAVTLAHVAVHPVAHARQMSFQFRGRGRA